MKDGRFTVPWRQFMGQDMDAEWISNKLTLDTDDIINNVHAIQDSNWLARSKSLLDPDYNVLNFTIEMETGTGKTYVYTRTALELYKKYWYKKFIIVVPSVAIREGVYQSLKNTEGHFKNLYWTWINFFKYNSNDLWSIADYAESNNVEIMIMNIDSFRKIIIKEWSNAKERRIHSSENEDPRFNWIKPIDVLWRTNPIVIIDEPQSVDNQEGSIDSIKSLNPLFILRYSATHKKKINLMYQLWPVEAYEKELVKHIQVLEVEAWWDINKPYMKLLAVEKKNGLWFSAEIELDVQDKKWKIKRKKAKVNAWRKSNLFFLSWERTMYDGYIIANINCNEWAESIEFMDGTKLHVWEVRWATNDIEMKRAQIRWTIVAHLDREKQLLSKGIKVISLFFIDKVDKYRWYTSGWEKIQWTYAEMFEEEYQKAVAMPKYRSLFETKERESLLNVPVHKIHDGYFSVDGKNKFKDSKEWWGNKDDYSTYERIVQNTKLLLSCDDPIRFIFSHSALREGWDNPNVFQICTLVETVDPFTKRQKIGRGLRLPVNQDGERIKDKNINMLTVVANVSYEMFAKTLQHEYEKATWVKFGFVEVQMFSNVVGEGVTEIWYAWSEKIFNYLVAKEYITTKWKVQDTLKTAVTNKTLELPDEFSNPVIINQVIGRINKVIKKLEISNKKDSVTVERIDKVFEMSWEFKELRNKIKHKTRYNINFEIWSLVEQCTFKIRNMPAVPVSKLFLKVSKLGIEKKWVTASDPQVIAIIDKGWYRSQLPDILRYLEDNTNLKRSTLARILVDSMRVERDFVINPQKFMEQVAQIINEEKQKLIVAGVTYEKTESTYDQEIFEKEMKGFVTNTVEVKRSLYSHVIYDSTVEEEFALSLDRNEWLVNFFMKLPPKFLIDTPLWWYNPDWAVLLDKDWVEKLYFIVETKSTEIEAERRWNENNKITCGRKHFEAIDNGTVYETATSFDSFIGKL